MARKHDRAYEDFSIGDSLSFTRQFSAKDFKAFAALSGDTNPLHHDRRYAAATQFGQPIVPLHLTAAPLSAIVGMMLPGHRALYLQSQIDALAPASYDRDITYSAKIIAKSDATQALTLRVLAFQGTEVLLAAELVVRVRADVPAELAPKRDDSAAIQRSAAKTAVITGATGAIGGAIAVRLAREGWDLILLHRGRKEAANRIKQRCVAAGAKASFLSGSLSDSGQLRRLCSNLAKRDDIAALIHTASPGIDAGLDALMAVNHSALARLSEALLPGMLRRQEGRILLLGSSAVQHNPRGWGDYIAAKAAASQWVSALNDSYGRHGIAGWVVAPGYVDTDFSRQFRPPEAPCLLPEQVAESLVDCLEKAPEGSHNYLWLEPQFARTGTYGFNQTQAAAPSKNLGLASSGASATQDQDGHNQKDQKVARLIGAFLGAGPDTDLSASGVDQFPGWDSLRHLELILHLERELEIAFTSGEMDRTTRFQDLCALVSEKLASTHQNA